VALERTDEPIERESLRLHLEPLGADHPGIVAEVSVSMAVRGVSIEELTTDVREAPIAGGTLFESRAVLTAPRQRAHRRWVRCLRGSPMS